MIKQMLLLGKRSKMTNLQNALNLEPVELNLRKT